MPIGKQPNQIPSTILLSIYRQ